MQKWIFYLVTGLLISSCSKKVTKEDITNISGYWEIEKVELVDGSKKVYKINEEVEYIQFNDNKGVRRKVILLYNGDYLLNNIKQKFTITERDGTFFISNATDFSEWEEEIEALTDSKLVLQNKEGIKYYYKKRNDIKLETNGKKE